MEKKTSRIYILIDNRWKYVGWIVLFTLLIVTLMYFNERNTADIELKSCVSRALAVLVFLGIGVISLFRARVMKDKRTYIFAIAVLITLTFISLFYFPEVIDAISAWTAIVVAIAAALAYDESRKLRTENNQMRNQEQERESRKARLDRVQKWIEDAIARRFDYERKREPLVVDRYSIDRLRVLLTRKTYVLMDAGILDQELNSISESTNEHKITRLIVDIASTFEQVIDNENLYFTEKRISEELKNNCNTVLEYIFFIRTKHCL